MEKKLYTITEIEHEVMKRRTEEIFESVKGKKSLTEALCEYAQENGYSEEEAKELVNEHVIPTVDSYNAGCRECMEGDMSEWIFDKISERVEDMTLEEECKFKLGVLLVIRNTSNDILRKEAERTHGEMEDTFFCNNDKHIEMLECGPYTEELLSQINTELAEAVENSGVELEMSNQIATFMEGVVDTGSVRSFVTKMWQDEQMKYCAAVAACVARKNNELPSIPDEIIDEALVIGTCQGIDIANVEKKVSLGEMTADTAHKILKVIAAVGMALFTAIVLILAGLGVAEVIFDFIIKLLGTSAVAGFVALGLAAITFLFFESEWSSVVTGAVECVEQICDFSYKMLKKAVKTVHAAVQKHVVPVLEEMTSRITSFVQKVTARVKAARVKVRNR